MTRDGAQASLKAAGAQRAASPDVLTAGGILYVTFEPLLFGHKNPDRDVNTRLGKEFCFLNVIALARRSDDTPRPKRVIGSANVQEFRDFGTCRSTERVDLGATGRHFSGWRKLRLLFQDQRKNRFALLRVAQRPIRCAVQGLG